MKNIEWIRNMTDEELAEFIAWLVDYETGLSFEDYVAAGALDKSTAADWFDWLQQEKQNG